MEAGDPRKALDALTGEHALPILRFLQGRAWTLASEVARSLGIHTTTAGKYLASFHDAGFVERRSHRARHPTFAYKLVSPVIRIELDLAERPPGTEVADVADRFATALLEAANKVGGPRLEHALVEGAFGGEGWRPALRRRLEGSEDPRTAFHGILLAARRTCADFVGASAASRMFRLAAEAAAEGRRDVVEGLGLEVMS